MSSQLPCLGAPERDTDLAADALLVGFRAAQRDHDALSHALDVQAVTCNAFRTTKAAGKADEQQRDVADRLQVVAHGRQHGEQVVAQQRPRLSPRGPRLRRMPRIVARISGDVAGFGELMSLVRHRDRRHPPDGADWL